MNINPISFGHKVISQFSARNNYNGGIEQFNVAEYNYHDADVARIGRNAQRWAQDPTQRENFAIAKDYSMSSMAGDLTKKYFGIEDTSGNIKKLLVTDLGRQYSMIGMMPPKEIVIDDSFGE